MAWTVFVIPQWESVFSRSPSLNASGTPLHQHLDPRWSQFQITLNTFKRDDYGLCFFSTCCEVVCATDLCRMNVWSFRSTGPKGFMSKAALKTSGDNRKNRHACAINYFHMQWLFWSRQLSFPTQLGWSAPFNIHHILFTDVSLLHGSYDIQELDLRHESKIEIILKTLQALWILF